MARYVGLLLASAEGFGLRPRLFCPLGKIGLFTLFLLVLGHFSCSVVTSVMYSSNFSNFEKDQNIPKKKYISKKKSKKILKNLKKKIK